MILVGYLVVKMDLQKVEMMVELWDGKTETVKAEESARLMVEWMGDSSVVQ